MPVIRPGLKKSKLSDLFKSQAVVEITPSSYGLAELPLLVMLGWYLMVMQQEDSAAVAATTATG